MTTLSTRILCIIRGYRRLHGYSPTLGDIAAALKCSDATVYRAIRQMKNDGVITSEGRHRSYRPKKRPQPRLAALRESGGGEPPAV